MAPSDERKRPIILHSSDAAQNYTFPNLPMMCTGGLPRDAKLIHHLLNSGFVKVVSMH